MMHLKIGISGKRHIHPDQIEKVYSDIKQHITDILKRNNTKSFTGYTSLAIGADTIFAKVVRNEFKQDVQVVLPLPLEEYKLDFESEDQLILESLLAQSQGQYIIESSKPHDKGSRNLAYYKAGKKIVDDCDEMIIVWDRLKPEGQGGTAEILGYATERKKKEKISLITVQPIVADDLHNEIEQTYETANIKAMDTRDKYKAVWRQGIILGWIAAVCFAVNTAFHPGGLTGLILSVTELILVVFVYVIYTRAKKKKYHGQYLEQRIKAEKLRLLQCFYHADMEVRTSKQSLKNDDETAVIASKINDAVLSKPRKSKWYAQYVVRSLIDDQCTYHDKKQKAIGNKFEHFELANKIVWLIFLLNLFLHVADDLFSISYPYSVSVFISILMPATYAALEGFIYFNEWKLLKKHSLAAGENLSDSKELLPKNMESLSAAECFQKQNEVLNLVSSTMLSDNSNWNLILEDKENYHLIV